MDCWGEQEVSINGDLAGEALVLKAWPQQEPARIISSIELNDTFAKLTGNHCIHYNLKSIPAKIPRLKMILRTI